MQKQQTKASLFKKCIHCSSTHQCCWCQMLQMPMSQATATLYITEAINHKLGIGGMLVKSMQRQITDRPQTCCMMTADMQRWQARATLYVILTEAPNNDAGTSDCACKGLTVTKAHTSRLMTHQGWHATVTGKGCTVHYSGRQQCCEGAERQIRKSPQRLSRRLMSHQGRHAKLTRKGYTVHHCSAWRSYARAARKNTYPQSRSTKNEALSTH